MTHAKLLAAPVLLAAPALLGAPVLLTGPVLFSKGRKLGAAISAAPV